MPKKRMMCPSCQSAAIDLIDFAPKSATDSALSRAPQEGRFATVTDVANARIHLVLGDIDTDDNQIILCHHPAPFLARSGLEAHATVRVEKDTGSVPRSPSGCRGLTHETGSDPATGGWSEPPVRTSWQILRTQEREGNR